MERRGYTGNWCGQTAIVPAGHRRRHGSKKRENPKGGVVRSMEEFEKRKDDFLETLSRGHGPPTRRRGRRQVVNGIDG